MQARPGSDRTKRWHLRLFGTIWADLAVLGKGRGITIVYRRRPELGSSGGISPLRGSINYAYRSPLADFSNICLYPETIHI